MKITVNFAPLIGWPIVLYTAFTLWRGSGLWLAIGALLCVSTVSITFRGGH